MNCFTACPINDRLLRIDLIASDLLVDARGEGMRPRGRRIVRAELSDILSSLRVWKMCPYFWFIHTGFLGALLWKNGTQHTADLAMCENGGQLRVSGRAS